VWGPTLFLSVFGLKIIGHPSLISPLDAILVGLLASVSVTNKQLTVKLNHLDATLTENRGWDYGLRHQVAALHASVKECPSCQP
jgi:hypothetical protein